jgi:hypothetical protein
LIASPEPEAWGVDALDAPHTQLKIDMAGPIDGSLPPGIGVSRDCTQSG